MSYGYEPPKSTDEGSWAEVWAIVKVVFSLLLPAVAALFGVILFIALSVWLFLVHPALLLIPGAAIAAGVWWLSKRDRQLQDAEERRIFGDRRPR